MQDNSKIRTNENNKSTSIFYLNFTFYKVDPKWRWLNDLGREEATKEFGMLLDVANSKIKVKAYSTLGLRKESEFMLWSISDSVEKLQTLVSKIYSTILGKYIDISESYLSMSRQSIYSNKIIPNFMIDAVPLKYNIIYPFIKSREWYLLPFEERKKMMDEHIMVGKKFPQIKLNTSYSFGIGDQDFMLAFETDNLSDFQDLIMKLRETQVSRYIIKDTPMIVCVNKDIREIIRSLG